MKIAYVVLLPHRTVGVERALEEKAAVLSRLSDGIDVIAVNRWRTGIESGVRYVRFGRGFPSPVRYLLSVLRRYRLIEKAVDLTAYDAVILRYPGADISGPAFAKRWPIVTEHHTRIVPEMESFREFPLPIAERVMKRVRLALERRYGVRIMARCRGIIAVTDEIREYELGRAGRDVPAITVPNGIDVAAIPQSGFVPFDGKELHLAFVAGIDAPWNGIDRLVAGLRAYTGDVHVTVHLIGGIAEHGAMVQPNVATEYHGRLVGAELDAVLSRMNLAVTTLGLHRKDMQEACALKTREYTARGLPFVIGHDDPDLAGIDQSDRFFLQVPGDDRPLDIEAIVEFARGLGQPTAVVPAMRSFATQRLRWETKLTAYVEFVHRAVQERRIAGS